MSLTKGLALLIRELILLLWFTWRNSRLLTETGIDQKLTRTPHEQ